MKPNKYNAFTIQLHLYTVVTVTLIKTKQWQNKVMNYSGKEFVISV